VDGGGGGRLGVIDTAAAAALDQDSSEI